jgi:hypothetical protein
MRLRDPKGRAADFLPLTKTVPCGAPNGSMSLCTAHRLMSASEGRANKHHTDSVELTRAVLHTNKPLGVSS